MRARTRVLALLAAAGVSAVLATGCGGGDSGDAAAPKDTGAPTSTSTSVAQGSAQITKLDAPATVACNGATSTKITVSYATTGASSKQLLVDGLRIDGTDQAAADIEVPIHCDTLPHTVVMVAKDGSGGKTVKQTMVTTELGSG
jgi:hypothetical protein